jgi:hypothetical protein
MGRIQLINKKLKITPNSSKNTLLTTHVYLRDPRFTFFELIIETSGLSRFSVNGLFFLLLFNFYLFWMFLKVNEFFFLSICYGYRLMSWMQWQKILKELHLKYQMVNWTTRIYCVNTKRIHSVNTLHSDYVKLATRMWVISLWCNTCGFY